MVDILVSQVTKTIQQVLIVMGMMVAASLLTLVEAPLSLVEVPSPTTGQM